MPGNALFALVAKSLIAVPEVLPPWLRRTANTLALVGGMCAFVYTVARAFGFEARSTGQRMTAMEEVHKGMALAIDTLHQADARLDARLDRIERGVCVQLTLRERDLIGSCYGTPVSTERARRTP